MTRRMGWPRVEQGRGQGQGREPSPGMGFGVSTPYSLRLQLEHYSLWALTFTTVMQA